MIFQKNPQGNIIVTDSKGTIRNFNPKLNVLPHPTNNNLIIITASTKGDSFSTDFSFDWRDIPNPPFVSRNEAITYLTNHFFSNVIARAMEVPTCVDEREDCIYIGYALHGTNSVFEKRFQIKKIVFINASEMVTLYAEGCLLYNKAWAEREDYNYLFAGALSNVTLIQIKEEFEDKLVAANEAKTLNLLGKGYELNPNISTLINNFATYIESTDGSIQQYSIEAGFILRVLAENNIHIDNYQVTSDNTYIQGYNLGNYGLNIDNEAKTIYIKTWEIEVVDFNINLADYIQGVDDLQQTYENVHNEEQNSVRVISSSGNEEDLYELSWHSNNVDIQVTEIGEPFINNVNLENKSIYLDEQITFQQFAENINQWIESTDSIPQTYLFLPPDEGITGILKVTAANQHTEREYDVHLGIG